MLICPMLFSSQYWTVTSKWKDSLRVLTSSWIYQNMQTLDGALDTTSVQLDHRKTFPQFRESAEAADELHFSTQ